MAFLEPGTPAAGADAVRELFRATYDGSAGVVARAPGRVNLIGEHTDYNGGLCLPLALAHATFAAVSPRGDEVVRVSSRQEPGVVEAALDEVGPGAVPGWAAYVVGVPWALREDGLDVPGLDVAIDSTVPIGSGLSSSAALECAVAVTVASLLGVPLDDTGRRRLAAACVRAEREFAGAPTGGMDQTIALLASPGSALLVDFADDSTTRVELALAEAGLALLVTDTKVSHALVDGGYGARRADCDAAAAELGVATLRAAGLAEVEELRRRPAPAPRPARGLGDRPRRRGRLRGADRRLGRGGPDLPRLARVDARRLRDLLSRAGHGRHDRRRGRRTGCPDDRRRLRRLQHRPGADGEGRRGGPGGGCGFRGWGLPVTGPSPRRAGRRGRRGQRRP